ncbi:MAG: hypothetical protein CM15mP107_3690 [Bacteroidota bacterium]|nr:MAG: hypothetical protein CM15mP107_3690 [Bacteroidota bacterium]
MRFISGKVFFKNNIELSSEALSMTMISASDELYLTTEGRYFSNSFTPFQLRMSTAIFRLFFHLL